MNQIKLSDGTIYETDLKPGETWYAQGWSITVCRPGKARVTLGGVAIDPEVAGDPLIYHLVDEDLPRTIYVRRN